MQLEHFPAVCLVKQGSVGWGREVFIGALRFLYSPKQKVNMPRLIPEKQRTYVLQNIYSQFSMGLAHASVCAQVCVRVLGCSSFHQLRIKIEGMRE